MKDLKGLKRVLLKLSGEALAGEKKTGFDEETGLALGIAREGDGLKITGSRQLTALPRKRRAALGQRAAHLDGDKIGELVAVLILIAAVRSDAQDSVGFAGGLVHLQFHIVGQIANGSDFQHIQCSFFLMVRFS